MRTSQSAQVTCIGLAAILTACAAAPLHAQSADFTPVTDAMLQDPAAEDWLMWRRTLDGWGFLSRNLLNR